MANKQINELVEKTTLVDADLLVLYDSEEAGSEKTKKLAYTNFPANSNPNIIINGDFNIWQRGTSFAAIANASFSADRFKYFKSGAMVHTITRDTDVPTLAQSGHQSNYSLKIDCTTIDASIAAGDFAFVRQNVEGYNFAEVQGKVATVSFWVKATKTGIYNLTLTNSTGTRVTYPTEYTINSSDTWEKKTVTVNFNDTSGTWLYTNETGLHVVWMLACGSNWQATADTWNVSDDFGTVNQVNACDSTANNFFLSQVKLEIGSYETPFKSKSIQEEIADCQRYYNKTYNIDVDPGTNSTAGRIRKSTTGMNNANHNIRESYRFPITMRDTPTVTAYTLAGTSGDLDMASGEVTATVTNTSTMGVELEGTNGAATATRLIQFHLTADAEL